MKRKLVTTLVALLISLAISSISLSVIAEEGLTNEANHNCSGKTAVLEFGTETLAESQSEVNLEPASVTEIDIHAQAVCVWCCSHYSSCGPVYILCNC